MKADKEKLVRKIMEDSAFADKLATMEDEAAALKFINENGINVTAQDLKEMDWTEVTINGRELPDEMMDNVAGGSEDIKKIWKKYLICTCTSTKS